ncbi:MAG: MFS transporter, partial [Pseudomonadota bacterium]
KGLTMGLTRGHALWVLLTSSTLTVMAGSIIAPVLNLMREGLDIEAASVGLIITTHGLSMALFSPLMGSLIDRTGPKRFFVLGLILYGLAGGSGTMIDSFGWLLMSRALLGVALAAFFNAITVIILHLYEGAERNRVMGWRGSTNSLGGIVWPLLGGFLGHFSWQSSFAVYFLGVPLGCLAFLTIPDIKVERRAVKAGEPTVWMLFREKPVLLGIYGFMFMTHLFLYSIVIYLPQRLEMLGTTEPFYIGLFMSCLTFAMGVISFNYARIKSGLSYQGILRLILALWAVAFAVLSSTSMIALIICSMALFGAGMGMVAPSIPVWVGETVPVSFRGRFSSYIGTAGFMGQFISPILFAPVFIFFGIKGIFLIASGVSALLFMVITFAL